MAFNYSGLRTTAINLIKQFGCDATLLHTTEATPSDATKPWRVGAGMVTQTSCRVVKEPVGGDTDEESYEITFTGDLPAAPTLTDRLKIGSTVFSLANIRTIDPGGTGPLVYEARATAWPLHSTQPRTGF